MNQDCNVGLLKVFSTWVFTKNKLDFEIYKRQWTNLCMLLTITKMENSVWFMECSFVNICDRAGEDLQGPQSTSTCSK